jgi:hypothetical protein
VNDIGSIVGIISGLIAIFTFATGINSIAELRILDRERKGASTPEVKLVRHKLMVVVPLFGVSIAVTAVMGFSGSDAGGIISLLLIISLLAVLTFHWLGINRIVPVTAYGVITVLTITGIGFLFGTISRGEEGFGLVAGMAIGVGSWVITALTRRLNIAPESDFPKSPSVGEYHYITAQANDERRILEIASQQNGIVRVTDISLKSNMSLDIVSQTLEGLVQRGYCRKEMLESGATVYKFPDLEER